MSGSPDPGPDLGLQVSGPAPGEELRRQERAGAIRRAAAPGSPAAQGRHLNHVGEVRLGGRIVRVRREEQQAGQHRRREHRALREERGVGEVGEGLGDGRNEPRGAGLIEQARQPLRELHAGGPIARAAIDRSHLDEREALLSGGDPVDHDAVEQIEVAVAALAQRQRGRRDLGVRLDHRPDPELFAAGAVRRGDEDQIARQRRVRQGGQRGGVKDRQPLAVEDAPAMKLAVHNARLERPLLLGPGGGVRRKHVEVGQQDQWSRSDTPRVHPSEDAGAAGCCGHELGLDSGARQELGEELGGRGLVAGRIRRVLAHEIDQERAGLHLERRPVDRG